MALIQPTYANRVRYTFIHEYGRKEVFEPVNWEVDELEFARNRDYDGIFANFSEKLEFTGEAAEYINNVRVVYGINAKIQVLKEVRHPHTDRWAFYYRGNLDMSTFTWNDDRVMIEFNSSSLEDKLKSRISEKVEIDSEKTMDGDKASDLKTTQVLLFPRRIFLRSKLVKSDSEESKEEYSLGSGTVSPGSQVDYSEYLFSPILDAEVNSDQEYLGGTRMVLMTSGTQSWHTIAVESEGTWQSVRPGSAQLFYKDNDREKTLNIAWNIRFNYTQGAPAWAGNPFIGGYLRVFENTGSIDDPIYEPKGDWQYHSHAILSLENIQQDPRDYTHKGNTSIVLREGESLMFCMDFPRQLDGYSNIDRIFKPERLDFTITQDSEYPQSYSLGVMANDLGKKLIELITGNVENFRSDILKNGDVSNSFFAHGFWIRGFKRDDEDEDNRFKPFKTSFKDFMDNLRATWDLGIGIENIGVNNDIVRVEPLDYFYQMQTTIKLGEVSDLTKSIAVEHYYSSAETGYDKPRGDDLYEEAMGLDEYNVKSNFITTIVAVDNKLSLNSPYRADSYGVEFARRMPYINYPTRDTSYDNDVFVIDTKETVLDWLRVPRRWSDDFDEKPNKVYDPDSAYNLRLSPANILNRHSKKLSSGLIEYPNKEVRFIGSDGNSRMENVFNGDIIKENGDIRNDNLDRPKILPIWIEFKHEVDLLIMQKIQGNSIVNGKKIRNFYGLVEFEFRGKKEYGFLFSVKPNSNEWKLLKANR